ncbi:hypothetical protein [Bradyrhizobium sp. 23AC]
MTIDEILEALCVLDGGPRQLHAGVAITVPRLGAFFHDRSKLPSDPRQQDAAGDIYRHRAG